MYTSPCRKVRVLGTSHPQSIDTCGSQNTYLPSLIIRSIFVTGRKVASTFQLVPCVFVHPACSCKNFRSKPLIELGICNCMAELTRNSSKSLHLKANQKATKGRITPCSKGCQVLFVWEKNTMSVYNIYSQKKTSQKYIHEYHLIFVHKIHNVKMCCH